MLWAVVQRDPMGYQQGTGPAAAVPGYQMAGKTGTAQQINPACGCYYDNYWITFAGMATVDDPRYVIGLMMENPRPQCGRHGRAFGCPLFHNIAGWLMQRENVPLSPDPGPPLTLQGDPNRPLNRLGFQPACLTGKHSVALFLDLLTWR